MLQAISIDYFRVFNQNDFFQQSEVKKVVEEVMCTWGVLNKEGYQQGMLYILSVVAYVVFHSEREGAYANTFMVFDRVMQIEFCKYFQRDPGYLLKKCNRIVNWYLKLVDVEVYLVLEKYKVPVELFLLYCICRKWLRCMFAKEFLFEEVIEIWNLVIKEYNLSGFYMMEFVALSMIVWARDAGIL